MNMLKLSELLRTLKKVDSVNKRIGAGDSGESLAPIWSFRN